MDAFQRAQRQKETGDSCHLSLWHTVSPHNTWAHSQHKISTPCGNNKTQLITYKVTWLLLCLRGVCVSEHGKERLRKTHNVARHPVSAKNAPSVPFGF